MSFGVKYPKAIQSGNILANNINADGPISGLLKKIGKNEKRKHTPISFRVEIVFCLFKSLLYNREPRRVAKR